MILEVTVNARAPLIDVKRKGSNVDLLIQESSSDHV